MTRLQTIVKSEFSLELRRKGLGVQASILFEEAELPTNPTKIVGQAFCFICDKDWRGTIIMGSITGLTANSQGVDVYISVPDVNDIPISHISYNRTYGGWVMNLCPNIVEGELVLFV